jgi:hypothetical protein
MKLLSQNSELRKDGIWCWTIPALSTKLESGSFVTCPNAGSCAQFCYARNGTYNFPAVRDAHRAKLERLLANPAQWVEDMVVEIHSKRSIPYLRIHDSGKLKYDNSAFFRAEIAKSNVSYTPKWICL